MAEKKIRVLVVDDSVLMREIICDLLADVPGVTVVGTAIDGEDALRKAATLVPDIITLDVQMPGLDGLQTLDALLQLRATPVIMVSALTQRAADITFQLLDRGALDYVPKPENPRTARGEFREELLHKVRMMAGADVERVLRIRRDKAQRAAAKPVIEKREYVASQSESRKYDDCCIALGISTGGPPALSELFQSLDGPLPPIVVVQHMPANFTGPFARRLNASSALTIKEAEAGDVLEPDHVFIAPGGKHLHLRREGKQVVAQIDDEEPVSSHKPSIDVLMQSAATVYGPRCLGLIMTGMGHDGAAGCEAIRAAGGYVLGQDEATSDVYGMNKAAFVNGHVDAQFALPDLPRLIVRHSLRMIADRATARPAPKAILASLSAL
jgi:two-component system chemotaxis response regulator CheB